MRAGAQFEFDLNCDLKHSFDTGAIVDVFLLATQSRYACQLLCGLYLPPGVKGGRPCDVRSAESGCVAGDKAARWPHWDGWGMAVEPASFNGYDNALTTEDDSLICSESSWSRITTPAQAGIFYTETVRRVWLRASGAGTRRMNRV